MTIRFYGQYGDDYLLWKFFDEKQTGFYVDVGAFDGVHLSNSYSFEQQGWTGVCVEAHPDFFEICNNARPQSTCVHAACVGNDEQDTITFYTEPLGLLSGTSPEEEDVKARYERRNLDFDDFVAITVPAMTLNKILEDTLDASALDFVSIDVEGTELDVLKGFDLNRFSPRVIVVEANNNKARLALESYLKPFGYRRARVMRENVYFVRSWLDVLKMKMIEVDCTLQSPPHPLGDQFTMYKEPRHFHNPSLQQRLWQRITGS